MASVAKRTWTYNGEEKTAWIVRYRAGGKHRQKTFTKKKAADSYRTKVESEMEDGVHIPPTDSVTVKTAIEQHLQGLEVKLAEGRIGRVHYEHSCHYLRKHVAPAFPNRRLVDLTWAEVSTFRSNLVTKSGLMPSTVAKLMSKFRLTVDLAVKLKQVKANVVADVVADNRGRPRREVRTFTIPEVAAILQAATLKPGKDQERPRAIMECAVWIASCCGLRHGEILGLTWNAVDLDQRVIHVRANLTRHDELKGPKTAAGVRDVPIPVKVVDLLTHWRRVHWAPEPRGLIFRNRAGGQIDNQAFAKSWHNLLAKAELDGLDDKGRAFNFHSLRHFAASMMITDGVSLMDVANLLGHSKFDMTLQVYAHPIIRGMQPHAVVDRIAAETSRPLLRVLPAALMCARGSHGPES